ncbi:hypothetical protein SKB0123_19800 [Staphylococcus capitis]
MSTLTFFNHKLSKSIKNIHYVTKIKTSKLIDVLYIVDAILSVQQLNMNNLFIQNQSYVLHINLSIRV